MFKKIFKETKNRDTQNQIPLIAISLFIVLFLGIIIITKFQLKQEEKDKRKDVLDNGLQMINLISLYPIKDFKTDKRDFITRTLINNSVDSGLVYCYIHDHTGKVIASFTMSDLVENSPYEVQTSSLATMGLTKQTFNEPGSGKIFYEYSKPIFENNQKAGIVRIGLKVPEIEVFKLERLSHLSLMVFFMFAAIIVFYYGIIIVFRPLKNIIPSIRKIIDVTVPENGHAEKDTNIMNFVGELNHTFTNIQDRITKIETENIELSTKMGTIAFEKDQIVHLLNSLRFGIITTDLNGNINYINDYIGSLIGKQLEDVIDRPLDQILKNDDIALHVLQFEETETSNNGKNIETTFPGLSPGESFGVSFYTLTDKVGESIGKMILIKNITLQKMGEKTQQEFISHVSHELLTSTLR